MDGKSLKQCGKCKKWLPANTDNFRVRKKDISGLSLWCKPCCKDYDKEYRKKNRDKKIKQIREWRKNNPNYNKEYYRDNLDYNRLRVREYYQDHKEERQEYSRNYGLSNRHKLSFKQRKYLHELHAINKFINMSYEDWKNTLNYFGNKCAYCGSDEDIQIDHLVPMSGGGAFVKGNIIPSCIKCNSSKRDKKFEEWYPLYMYYSKDRLNIIKIFISKCSQEEV